MERYSSNSKKQVAPAAQQAAGAAQETFSEMANVTAAKSGLIGKLLVLSLIIVSLAVTAFVGFAILNNGVDGNRSANVDEDKFQAIFLTDGQIYFGKLDESSDDYAVLRDIYYLQVEQQVQPVQGEELQQQARISLAKLGNELHGPEDEMFVNRDQILFWENLKDEGQVVEAITDFKNNEASEDTTTEDETTLDTEAAN